MFSLPEKLVPQKWWICHFIEKTFFPEFFPMFSQHFGLRPPATCCSGHSSAGDSGMPRLEGLGPFVLRFYPRGVESPAHPLELLELLELLESDHCEA
jgi:hypothetical protein